MTGAAWLLPLAPRPCPRETMSSWLSRVGCRYDMAHGELLESVLPARGGQACAPRFDWQLAAAEVTAMAQAARLPVASVAALDAASTCPGVPLQGFAWTFAVRDPSSRGDVFGGPLARGWCGQCLADQFQACGQEYVLPDWGLAYTGHCHIHERPLSDRCPACGSDQRPVHVPDRLRTRLACNACDRFLTEQHSPDTEPSAGTRTAERVLLAFERDLICVAAERQPSHDWAGAGSGAALIALVDDVAVALCPERGYKLPPAVRRFDLTVGVEIRDVPLPGLDHPLCGLPPRGRLRMLAAVLAVIGDEHTASTLLGDDAGQRASAKFPNDQHGGPLEWLVRVLTDRDLVRLLERSSRWPLQAHARLRHAVVLSGRVDRVRTRDRHARAEAVS